MRPEQVPAARSSEIVQPFAIPPGVGDPRRDARFPAPIIGALGLTGKVSFTGQRGYIPHPKNLTDLVVPSSIQSEPFGRVIIETLSADELLRRRMGAAGLRRAHEHFPQELCADAVRQIYKTIVSVRCRATEPALNA
ncbi:MAG: hypothetical protein ABIF09_03745 [Gemmatimonadota bacterium]